MSGVVNQNTLNFVGLKKKFTRPPGKQQLDFRLPHDKVVHRETAANVCASLPIKIIFLPSFSSWDV